MIVWSGVGKTRQHNQTEVNRRHRAAVAIFIFQSSSFCCPFSLSFPQSSIMEFGPVGMCHGTGLLILVFFFSPRSFFGSLIFAGLALLVE